MMSPDPIGSSGIRRLDPRGDNDVTHLVVSADVDTDQLVSWIEVQPDPPSRLKVHLEPGSTLSVDAVSDAAEAHGIDVDYT